MKARSISKARVRETSELIVAEEAFTDQKTSFGFREMKNSGKLHFDCLECNQELKIQPSSRDRMYFSHKPKSKDCLLKQGSISQAEADSIVEYIAAKESDRHKYLKHLIGEKLRATAGVKADSVRVDDYVIVKGDQKRRPDVYCVFEEKEVVFEIQLSNLSQAYILSRHNFYSKHNIYLIWILDNFDCKNPKQPFVRDLKYVAPHHNYFRLDERSEQFRLECDFKKVFEVHNEVRSVWKNQSIDIHELIFDDLLKQAYFYNLEKEETELKSLIEEKIEIEQIENDKMIASQIVSEIGRVREKRTMTFNHLSDRIEGLTNRQVEFLNERLHSKPFQLEMKLYDLVKYRKDFNDDEFLHFLLKQEKIHIDVNFKQNGTSFFIELMQLDSYMNGTFLKFLLQRGYKITDEDETILEHHELKRKPSEGYIDLLRIANRLSNRMDLGRIFENDGLFYTLETIHRNKVVGHRYSSINWIQIVNLELNARPQFWHLVQRKLKHVGLFDDILTSDKKSTFKSKLDNYKRSQITPDLSLNRIVEELYF